MTLSAVPPVVPIRAAGELDLSVVGGKAAGLARMIGLGLPVPPAFVITTPVCLDFRRRGRLSDDVLAAIGEGIAGLERESGRSFGDPRDPLLVSVRSGAAVSMPGMMDTILDLGIDLDTPEVMEAWPSRGFANACRERFVEAYLAVTGAIPPSSPFSQLEGAIEAVLASWDNDRAQTYRNLHEVDHDLGTAVVVQAMVFGNRNEQSGTGVVMSRNPNTGEPGLYGDYLDCAQGEDVVAGTHRTLPIAQLADHLPEAGRELAEAVDLLERDTADMVDVEFTIDDGRLHILQTRSGKRAAAAAVRIVVDLVDEGLIDRAEAVRRVTDEQLDAAQQPRMAVDATTKVLAVGLGACPGVVSGVACFSPDRMLDMVGGPDPLILVRRQTSPADMHGMAVADGVLTEVGGLVSHAALVARELDLPTVVGASDLDIDEATSSFTAADTVVNEGDTITIDGATGIVVLGAADVVEAGANDCLETLRQWRATSS